MSSSKKEDDKAEESVSHAASGSSNKMNPIELLASYLKDSLHLSRNDTEPKILENPTVDAVVEYILSGKCKHIVTMVGAGISTSAGIPDFRSPGSGLYDNLQKYDLPHPEAIFTLDYFYMNAKPFFELAKDLYPGTFKPTKTHYFIKMLADKGLLLRHYTQNIDTLERITGLESDKLVEAHGTFHTGHCLGCRKEYTQDWMKERIFADEVPICEDCPGVVKPDIVFFGENLPRKFFKCSNTDFKKCDLLIVMGSSLAVQPFASLADRVSPSCPRILINLELAGDFQIGRKHNYRDVGMIGDCDKQCQLLADKLGWGDDLKELVKTEYARIDKISTKTKK